MRGRRGRIAAGLVLCMALLLFGGCSVGGTKIFFASGCGWNDMFKIGGMACSQKEAKVYLMNYKNLYGVVYDTDLWSGDFDTETVENTLKEEVLQYLTRVYTLNVYAKEQDIALDSGEEDAVKQAAAEYYDSLSEAERSYSGASQSDIERMYQRYALAVKVYEQLMESVDEEISEDEARVMDANLIFVTDEARANEIEQSLAAGASFTSLAQMYNELDQTSVSFGRGQYPEAVEQTAFSLENDQISGKIAADGGYYFIQCVNKYNQELSEANKERIITTRQQRELENITASLEENRYCELNKGLWNRLHVENGTELTTDSFFRVIESHMHGGV